MKLFTKSTAGYSLVEVLVAISILLIVVTGPLTILTSTARSSSYAAEQVTAFFLAQEGLELMQKRRDNFFLEHFDNPTTMPNPWESFVASVTTSPDCSSPDFCRIEVADDGSVVIAQSDSFTLSRSTETNLRSQFTYGDGTATFPSYSRRVQVEPEPLGNDALKVTSEVFWISGNVAATQRVVLTTYLYNSYDI